MFKDTHIPAIPMIAILRQFAYANKMPFDMRWETITRLYDCYAVTAKFLN